LKQDGAFTHLSIKVRVLFSFWCHAYRHYERNVWRLYICEFCKTFFSKLYYIASTRSRNLWMYIFSVIT
jgi:hypothetical protein